MTNKNLEDLHSVVIEYGLKYFSGCDFNLELSALYFLNFEGRKVEGRHPVMGSWEDDNHWPNATQPGIYAILTEDLEVLYVGKSRKLGKRLSDHFEHGKDRSTSVSPDNYEWTKPPCYVVTVAVQEPYEAASLEECLIQKLGPPDNTAGKEHEESTE